MNGDQFRNLLVFLMLATNEGAGCLLDKSPSYLLEKYFRYINMPPVPHKAWEAGLHPWLRRTFDEYIKHWRVDEIDWPDQW